MIEEQANQNSVNNLNDLNDKLRKRKKKNKSTDKITDKESTDKISTDKISTDKESIDKITDKITDKESINKESIDKSINDTLKLIKIVDINTLVTGGGAMKGLLFIGVIKLLFEYQVIKKIKFFYGTSFGAILSTCLILGWNLDEILKIITKFPIDTIINYDLDYFIETYGLVPKK